MTDRPLHVQVAEALGQFVQFREGYWCGVMRDDDFAPIPRYDTDWAATGPLIEKHRIWLSTDPYLDWNAARANDPVHVCNASTPLKAVCLLILALHKAGKLT